MNSRWVCLWFGPGNLFFQAKDLFCGKALLQVLEEPAVAQLAAAEELWRAQGLGCLYPSLYPDGRNVVGKFHAHRWAGSCFLASKGALLPRLCDISPVNPLWLWDLWVQHRVGLVPGSWEIKPGGFRCETS